VEAVDGRTADEGSVILFLNGAFGIGKTTVARALKKRLPRVLLYDPELVGIALQRITRVDDFQDLRAWRRLTILGLRIARLVRTNVIVPMAISNPAYLQEIRDGVRRFEPHVVHVCLVAPVDVVHARQQQRGATGADAAWQFRRAAECCIAHAGEEFAEHVSAQRGVEEIVDELLQAIPNHPSR
jgi:adenylylsulfate kinase-like enzyme